MLNIFITFHWIWYVKINFFVTNLGGHYNIFQENPQIVAKESHDVKGHTPERYHFHRSK